MIQIKTITKIFALAGGMFCGLLVASDSTRVTLRALDQNGSDLSQAQVGKPFILEVVVEGAHGNISDPVIENVPSGVQRIGYKMYMVNGVTRIHYTYRVQIDTQGTHSVGPACIEDGGVRKQSNMVTVRVGQEERIRGTDPHAKNKKHFVRLVAQSDHVVVGQKIEGTITFYSRASDLLIRQLQGPAIEGLTKIEQDNPEQGEQDIDGYRYRYVRWHWYMFAKKSGELVIPACSLDIVVQNDEDDFAGGFGSMFRFGATPKQVSSNSLTITVDTLPVTDRPVDGVGHFRTFAAVVNQTVAREGDGIALTLSLEGSGNFDQVNLTLQGLPPVFKSYSSKSHVEEISNRSGDYKKTSEFVVQAMEPGEWDIPEQSFTYYDVKERAYKTLKTSPITLKILRHQGTSAHQESDDDVATSIDVNVSQEQGVPPLNRCDSWCAASEMSMPWSLFMILFFAPLILWFSALARRGWHRLTSWRGPQNRWKSAFKSAHKHIVHAKYRHSPSALYAIFVELFALRCAVTPAQVSDEMTRGVLTNAGCSLEQINEWEKFFAHISAYVFYSVQGKDEDKSLFEQAEKWVHVLEKIL
jgi:hypothetical protein